MAELRARQAGHAAGRIAFGVILALHVRGDGGLAEDRHRCETRSWSAPAARLEAASRFVGWGMSGEPVSVANSSVSHWSTRAKPRNSRSTPS